MRITPVNSIRQSIDRFLYSPAFFVLVGVLTVLSNVFEMEVLVYPCMIFLGVYICLFARDMLPLMPLFACGYISPSMSNNPGFHEDSIFSFSEGGGYYILGMAALVLGCMVYRLVRDPDFGGKKFLCKKRKLLSGMLVLGICYAISGLFSGQWEEYGGRNLFFAFLQFVAITGLYFLLSGAVKWDQAPKDYLAWTGICVGYVLIVELANIYMTREVFAGDVFYRARINTGWGHYNSMGALFTILIPLPLLLSDKGRGRIWFAYATAFFFWLGLLLTCSRISILMGTVVFAVCYVLSLVFSRPARKQILLHILMVLVPVVLLIIFRDEAEALFGRMSDFGYESFSQRSEGYREGIKQFLKYPIFGGSFFPVDYDLYVWAPLESFTSVFPGRWHNTVIQLLATGGITCLAAYGYHRIQTGILFFKRPSSAKFFAGMSVAALLLTSLLDCHFFNVGPVLLYSMTLAFVEFCLDRPKQ